VKTTQVLAERQRIGCAVHNLESITELLNNTTTLGRALFHYLYACPSSCAVRARRNFMASVIDEVATQTSSAEMLSVACGHLREAKLSRAVANGQVSRLVGLDADVESLAIVKEEAVHPCIQAIHGSVKALITGKQPDLGQFDLIYSPRKSTPPRAQFFSSGSSASGRARA
jgi:hypothetical protein